MHLHGQEALPDVSFQGKLVLARPIFEAKHSTWKLFCRFVCLYHGEPPSSRNVVREAAMLWMQSIGHRIYLVEVFVDNSVVGGMP